MFAEALLTWASFSPASITLESSRYGCRRSPQTTIFRASWELQEAPDGSLVVGLGAGLGGALFDAGAVLPTIPPKIRMKAGNTLATPETSSDSDRNVCCGQCQLATQVAARAFRPKTETSLTCVRQHILGK